MRALLVAAASALALAGCSSDQTEPVAAPPSVVTYPISATTTTPGPIAATTAPATISAPLGEKPPTTTIARAANRPRGYVSEATWTAGQWPFTVPDGVVTCAPDGPQQRVAFVANRAMYAVNGTARAAGLDDLSPIWKESPSAPGLKIDIGPLIRFGLTLC